ncbi:protein BUNDLE SHEATH DEFECTIVE 2, chloroplastic [Gastrolobium bilobum]|uniref:protein BUNDLE SHEATH DEFECTIVE 2, chloroplastic n=1 Tax=Gastrolobium bilobum TaxID=150636 RepID=UPI002AB16867|nr:protein BUNDLE SHEATH DEFECTIVE 2, chloroplastic [Gastrolobium bilobum]XP_061345303.1 protein BUNDLE SHEATH DEFECTIVE 2, chloroplastic [Gastrolobium bilobum]
MNQGPLRTLVTGAAVILGGVVTLNLASTATLKALNFASELKRKKIALPCRACRGKGFYICKLCNGNVTIAWSPMYDPIAINPCVCPTCEGNRVQRCLNCLGKGYD